MCNCKCCKNYQPKVNEKIQKAWDEKKRLHNESGVLFDKSSEYNYGRTYTAKFEKYIEEADKLRIEGNLVFINAVIEVYGEDIEIDWDLENDTVFVDGIEYK